MFFCVSFSSCLALGESSDLLFADQQSREDDSTGGPGLGERVGGTQDKRKRMGICND